MSPSPVVEMIRPFDPTAADAEERYDAVVRRLNRVRARRTRIEREQSELERRFLDEDPDAVSDRRRSETLATPGRRAELERLYDLEVERRRLRSEERFSADALQRMNEALDRWARETYGP